MLHGVASAILRTTNDGPYGGVFASHVSEATNR
jgi:hypothetical protein